MVKKIKIVLYIVLIGLFFIISNYAINELNIFINLTVYLLTILFSIALGYLIFRKNYLMVFLFYFMMIFVMMFFRKDVAIIDKAYSFDFYLFRWLKLLDRNIVFLNIIGNIVIFMPLLYFFNLYFKDRLMVNYITCILIILLFELLQAVTRKGIFDVVDIFLNVVGITIVVVVNLICKGVRQWNKNQKNQMMNKKSKN